MRSTVSEILTQVGLLLLLGQARWHHGGDTGDNNLVRFSLPTGPSLLFPAKER